MLIFWHTRANLNKRTAPRLLPHYCLPIMKIWPISNFWLLPPILWLWTLSQRGPLKIRMGHRKHRTDGMERGTTRTRSSISAWMKSSQIHRRVEHLAHWSKRWTLKGIYHWPMTGWRLYHFDHTWSSIVSSPLFEWSHHLVHKVVRPLVEETRSSINVEYNRSPESFRSQSFDGQKGLKEMLGIFEEKNSTDDPMCHNYHLQKQ